MLALARTEIRSPIDGVVLDRLVGPGSPVSPREGPAILSRYEPQRLQVRADIANADIGLVGAGMPATITVDALPNRAIAGTVRRVTAQADIQKNSVQVKIEVHDPPSTLPEMPCRVRIGGAAANAATRQRIYALASLLRDGVAIVARPDRDGLARLESRRVALGEAREGWVEVTDGLRPGELLVDPNAAGGGEWVRIRNSVHEGTGGRDAVR